MKKILALLLFTAALTSVHSQTPTLGWSLGDLGWSHGFFDDSNHFTANIMNIYLSFEAVNLTLKTSVISTAGVTNDITGPTYTSFFPLELIYTPFKWEYANMELYAKGAWETVSIGDTDNRVELSKGLSGSAGLRLNFVPITRGVLGYRFYLVNVFAEYTSRSEFRAGINIDTADMLMLFIMGWFSSVSTSNDKDSYY